MATTTTEEIKLGALAIRFLIEREQSGGTVAVFEFDVPAGARVPIPHSHDAYEETIYGVRGTLTWTIDGKSVDVGAGEALCIRRGVVHHFENRGDEDATSLAVVTPGVLGPGYFLDLQALVASAAGGPPDPAAMAEVMLRHGLTPAP